LAYVRFAAGPTPLPRAPLTKTLLLDSHQRITGALIALDAKNVVFATSWGKVITLAREQILGIENANDSLPILHDDFEMSTKPWQQDGKHAPSNEHAFFGKARLLFEKTSPNAERAWNEPLRDGAIRLYFFDAGSATARQWTLTVLTTRRGSPPAFIINAGQYEVANLTERFGPGKASPGWHLLSIEFSNERMRFFVDDRCLGQTPAMPKEAITAIRCTLKGDAKIWIDEFSVTRRVPPLPRPAPIKEQDSIWLENGEQVFGNILSANTDGIVLDAKFGKREYPWSKMRGILFAQAKPTTITSEPAITFRPGPGFSLDQIDAKLIRWEEKHLLIEHRLLGEITLERDRLDKLRFVVK
jgi:hypothetical protein